MKTISFFRSFFTPLTAFLCFVLSAGPSWSQPCTNVKSAPFSAKGDGVNDDTEAIRKAFATATDCVYFPAGVYIIDPGMQRHMALVKGGMTVRGERGRSVLKIKDNSMTPHASPQEDAFEQMLLGREAVLGSDGILRFPPIKNVTIKDMVFDANYRGNATAVDAMQHETSAVGFMNVTNLTVQNCAFLNAGMACLVLVTCNQAVLKDNYLYDVGQGKHNGDAIQTNGCTGSRIDNNVLENVGEGIFCQHHAPTRTPDTLAVISLNKISTLDSGQVATIKTYIPAATLAKMNAGSLLLYKKPGRAIGPAIGILSNNCQVYNNYIIQHLGIAVQAFKGHGNLPTTGVMVRDNSIVRNAKVKYFDAKQQAFIRNVNGAFIVTASGQQVRNVTFRNNRLNDSFNSGVDLGVFASADGAPGILDGIVVEGNSLMNTCLDSQIDKCAAIDFRNGNLTTPNGNVFRNITLKNNQLGYAVKGHGLWLEPCMSNVRILQNTFIGDPAFKVNAAPGSCVREIAPTGIFTPVQRNFLQCLMEAGAPAIGTCSPAQTTKCVKCE